MIPSPSVPHVGKKELLLRCALACASLAVSVAFFEGLSAYLMLSGLQRGSPAYLLNYYRGYYWNSPYRHVIQFDPRCAVYDSEVYYRLRPGNCVHSGLRFSTAYSINSLGVRDSEESLAGPEIISIGDSHAMGWGVDQQDTYTKIIERKTGMRALNMGISGYGTAREMTLLKRADLSRLKYLVIQYDDFDLRENVQYLANGRKLKIGSAQSWARNAAREQDRRYYPGAHFAGLLRSAYGLLNRGVLKRTRPGDGRWIDTAEEADRHARVFLDVLASFNMPELHKARIIVLDFRSEIQPEIPAEASFSAALARLTASGNYERFANRITVLDLAQALNGAEYRQIIDNHINTQGHRLIADAVLRQIK